MRLLLLLLALALGAFSQASAQVLTLPPKLVDDIYYNQVLDRTNIVAFYTLDETVSGGATVVDETGGGADGSMSGAGNLSNVNGLAPPTTTGTGGISFAGTNGNIASLYNLDCDADWTLGFYMLPTATADGPIVTCASDNTLLRYDTASEVLFWNYGAGLQSFAYTFTPGETYQVFVTYDVAPTEELTLFVNGVEEESVAVSMGAWSGELALGVTANSATFLEDMTLDAFQVYDAVESPALIARDYYQRTGNPVYSTNYVPTQYALVETQEGDIADADYCLDVSDYIGHARYLVTQQTLTISNSAGGVCSAVANPCITISPSAASGAVTLGTCTINIEDPAGNDIDFEIPLRVEDNYDPDRVVVVDTQADLLAEFALWTTPADSVGVLRLRDGFYAANDGGALTFIFDEDDAAPLIPRYRFPAGDTTGRSFSATIDSSRARQLIQLPFTPVVPGSVEITITATDPDAGAYEVVITDEYLHGASYQSQAEWLPLDYRTGLWREAKSEGGYPFKVFLSRHLGGTFGAGWTADVDITYASADDDYVWFATHTEGGTALSDTTEWQARWFGAQSHADSAYFDNRNIINWAAYAMKDRNRLDTAFVYNYVTDLNLADLECPRYGGAGCDGETFYRSTGVIQMPEYAGLSGDVGAVAVDSTYNTFTDKGWGVTPGVSVSFTDVVVPDSATVLKVLPRPGTAGCTDCREHLATAEMATDFADALHTAPDAVALTGGGYSTLQTEHDSRAFPALTDLVLDGGLAEHRADVFTPDSLGYTDSFLNVIWNTPAASGVVQSTHAGRRFNKRQFVHLRRSAIIETLNNGLLIFTDDTPRSVRDRLDTLVVGTAAWNHGLYLYDCADGTDVKLTGGGWSHMAGFCVNFDGFVMGDLEQGVRGTPMESGDAQRWENNIVQYRGQAWRDSVAAIVGEVDLGQETGPFRFSNIHLDLTGVQGPPAGGGVSYDSTKAYIFNQGGPHFELLSGTIIQNEEEPLALYNSNGADREQKMRWKGLLVKDINWFTPSTTPDTNVEGWMGPNSWDQAVVENVRFFGDADPDGELNYAVYLAPRLGFLAGGESPLWQRYSVGEDTLSGQSVPIQVGRIGHTDSRNVVGGVSRHFIHDSRIDNSSAELVLDVETGSAKIREVCPSWPGTPCAFADSMQVYVSDTDINVYVSGTDQSLFFALARLDNVTDSGAGLSSEANDTYTCTSGDDTVALIDPALLYVPHPVRGSVAWGGTAPTPTSYRWLNAEQDEIAQGDAGRLTDPLLEVTFPSDCAEGLVLSYTIAISEWEDEDAVAVTLPGNQDASDLSAFGWEWVEMPLPTTPGATDGMTCRDGTATGYGILRRGGATNRMIYLQGGGAGFDGITYNGTPAQQRFATFVESIDKREELGGGIIGISNAANPFDDWEVVFVPYCTGDVHGGTNEDHVAPGWGLQRHVGLNNIEAVLDDLAANEMAPDSVALAGSSAGGFGVQAAYETVARAYISGSDTTHVHMFVDAGPVPADDAVLAPALQEIWRTTWDLEVPTGCGVTCDAADGDGFEEVLPWLAGEYPKANFGVFSCEQDLVIRSFFARTECDLVCQAIGGQAFEDALYGLRATYPSNVSTFFFPGTCHVGLVNAATFTRTVEGDALIDWIEDVLGGTAADVPTDQ